MLKVEFENHYMDYCDRYGFKDLNLSMIEEEYYTDFKLSLTKISEI